MEHNTQFLETEPVGRLMRRYALPCVISLLVGALYNIVDQIFIANASYLGSYGNAANTVVFPLTVVALAIAISTGKAILLQWNKRRWYRYQKGLRQRDVADYAGIDRSTYIHYEEAGRDFYPKEHMEKLAELFEVPLEDLLDDYNLFLLRGQGAQIKAIRQRLGLTQKAYAAQLGVPLQKFKRWEQGNVQIFKSTWERYFKQSLESCG